MTLVVGTVGTDHHPFDRFLVWMGEVQSRLGVEVMVQRGATAEVSTVSCVEYLAADELEGLLQRADAAVCHGGPGTISLAMRCGHRPIVIARDPARGEHVDDHQMRYLAKLHAEGVVDAPRDVDELIALLSVARPRTPVDQSRRERDEAVVRFGELVGGLLDGNLPPRPLSQRFLVRRRP